MLRKCVLAVTLLLGSGSLFAADKPPVQIVQDLALVGMSTEEVAQLLNKQISALGYTVISDTEKPKGTYYILSILSSSASAGGAIATAMSSAIVRQDGQSDSESLVNHSTSVLLLSGPTMDDATARRQATNALRGIVDDLDKILQAEKQVIPTLPPVPVGTGHLD